MRLPRARSRWFGASTVLAATIIAALLIGVPAPGKASPTVTAVPVQSSGGVAYAVTWNGADVSTDSSASSALSIDLTQSANLLYNWTVSSGAAAVTIKDARLQMFYLGFAVSTRDQVLSNPTPGSGSIPLSWTPVSVAYLLEGVYRLTASFIASNGTTMWSENFYARGTAPLGILAILPIVLLIIVVYEVYMLVRSGRYAMLGRKAPEPSAPASGAPPAQPPSGEETGPSPDSSEPSGESTPPTGGGS